MSFKSGFILQSWHEKIDVKSTVLPKIIKFLQSESHLLSGIYPRILPLVAAIPQEDLEDFYAEVLASIKSGLKTFVIATRTPKGPGGGSSLQSGGSACVMAYFEVALHCLKNSRIHSPIFDQVRTNMKKSKFICTFLFLSRFSSGYKIYLEKAPQKKKSAWYSRILPNYSRAFKRLQRIYT